jgi:hypothetical protein
MPRNHLILARRNCTANVILLQANAAEVKFYTGTVMDAAGDDSARPARRGRSRGEIAPHRGGRDWRRSRVLSCSISVAGPWTRKSATGDGPRSAGPRGSGRGCRTPRDKRRDRASFRAARASHLRAGARHREISGLAHFTLCARQDLAERAIGDQHSQAERYRGVRQQTTLQFSGLLS